MLNPYPRRSFAMACALALPALLAGCGSPSPQQDPGEATAVVDSPEGRDTHTVSSEPSPGTPSKRIADLRGRVERELEKAYEAHGAAEVDFDSLSRVQNAAFDNISLADSEGVACSFSMSTLPDHIFVYLSCEDDTQEFDWRPDGDDAG